MNETKAIKTTETPDCPVCGSRGERLYRNVQDGLFGVTGHYSYRSCSNRNCQLIWLDPTPLPEELPKAYLNYYTHSAAQKEARGVFLRRLARLPANLVDSLLLRLLGIKKERRKVRYLGLDRFSPGRLLEIGCGRGDRLSDFQRIGWSVTGQDVDLKAVEYVRSNKKVDVLCGDILDLNLEPEQFDAIVMNHVIEHVSDLNNHLAECLRLLKTGGLLVVSTPNSNSLAHRKFKADWRGLEPPRHLQIFSIESLEKVLKKAGFCVIESCTNATRSRGFFESSYQLRDEGRANANKYPRTGIYYKSIYYQYKEWNLWRIGQPVGEDLLAIARKPGQVSHE
jgi:2-polyprenyl-3-methyl-5-hydroxy-6-metoxy-1,4-benzoquinol methylase